MTRPLLLALALAACARPTCPAEADQYAPIGERVASPADCPPETCPLLCSNVCADYAMIDTWCEDCDRLDAFMESCDACNLSELADGQYLLTCPADYGWGGY